MSISFNSSSLAVAQEKQINYNQTEDNESSLKQNDTSTNAMTNRNQSSSNQENSSNTFQFISFVIEPNKKQINSMKRRDKTKAIIDQQIIDKQLSFQNRVLQYYQRSLSDSSTLDKYSQNKSNKKRKNNQPDKISVVRGNLGFCPLDMSLVNLCGVPSLWLEAVEYVNGSSSKQNPNNGEDDPQPYIKQYQKKLLKKQYKVYELLRFHKIFENEKYFGRTINSMHHLHNLPNVNLFQDYYYFATEFLKENTKFQSHQVSEIQSKQVPGAPPLNQLQFIKDKASVLTMVQCSYEVVQPELPIIMDPEAASYKLINSEAKILKQILQSQGFTQTDQNDWNILWTSISLQNRQNVYECMNDHQKINHFLNSTELTRKDRFAENIHKMKEKFGFLNFDFAPETYQLPEDNQAFFNRFNQIKFNIEHKKNGQNRAENEPVENETHDNIWIVKPSQSSQGKGIYIIEDLNEIQSTSRDSSSNEKTVVCKYISNPLLINNHKFDLRIYVLVTCVDPLRIYIYNEGLVRFASEPYDVSNKGPKKNLYSHLTNYSINKKSETFQQNKSVNERDHGNKWSLSALQTHFEAIGINMQIVWERIYDSIIKSIVSVENYLLQGIKKIQNSSSRQNCFELFGFDILLDTNFKPHILEVNFSPSLSADSPLDYHIKSNLLVDTLNIVGIKRNPKKRGGGPSNAQRFRAGGIGGYNSGTNGNNTSTSQSLGFNQVNQAQSKQKNKERNLNRQNSQNDMQKFSQFLNGGSIDQYFLDRLSKISAKHRELVLETLDEFQRNKSMNFTCVYPSPGCHMYDKYFVQPRQSNQLIHRYLFTKNELYTLTKQICDYQKQTQMLMEQSNPTKNNSSQKKQKVTDYSLYDPIAPIDESFDCQEEQDDNDDSTSNQEDNKSDEAPQEIKKSPQRPQTQMEEQIPPIIPGTPQKANEQNSPIIINQEDTASKMSPEKKDVKIDKAIIQDEIFGKLDNQNDSHSTGFEEDKSLEIKSPEKARENDVQLEQVRAVMNPVESKRTAKQELQVEIPAKNNNSAIKPQEQSSQKAKSGTMKKEDAPNLVQPPTKKEAVATPAKRERMSKKEKRLHVSPPKTPVKNQLSSTSPTQIPQAKQASQEVKSETNNIPAYVKSPTMTSSKAAMSKKTTTPPITQLAQDPQSPEVKVEETVIALDQTDLKTTEPSPHKLEEGEPTDTLNFANASTKLDALQAPTEDSKEEQLRDAKKEKQKMVITGDDILIEYVHRILNLLQNVEVIYKQKYSLEDEDDEYFKNKHTRSIQVDESQSQGINSDVIIPPSIRQTLEKFTKHKIWSNKFTGLDENVPIKKRIKTRHNEMVERRRRILKSQYRKQNGQSTADQIQQFLEKQDITREKIVTRISSQKIEKMVKQSNIENQIEIVSILVEGNFTLPDQMLTSSGKQHIKGTLQSLKLFEKIIKQTDQNQFYSNFEHIQNHLDGLAQQKIQKGDTKGLASQFESILNFKKNNNKEFQTELKKNEDHNHFDRQITFQSNTAPSNHNKFINSQIGHNISNLSSMSNKNLQNRVQGGSLDLNLQSMSSQSAKKNVNNLEISSPQRKINYGMQPGGHLMLQMNEAGAPQGNQVFQKTNILVQQSNGSNINTSKSFLSPIAIKTKQNEDQPVLQLIMSPEKQGMYIGNRTEANTAAMANLKQQQLTGTSFHEQSKGGSYQKNQFGGVPNRIIHPMSQQQQQQYQYQTELTIRDGRNNDQFNMKNGKGSAQKQSGKDGSNISIHQINTFVNNEQHNFSEQFQKVSRGSKISQQNGGPTELVKDIRGFYGQRGVSLSQPSQNIEKMNNQQIAQQQQQNHQARLMSFDSSLSHNQKVVPTAQQYRLYGNQQQNNRMNTDNEVVHGGKSEKSSRSQLLLDTSNQARVSVKKNPDNNAYIQLHGGTPGQNQNIGGGLISQNATGKHSAVTDSIRLKQGSESKGVILPLINNTSEPQNQSLKNSQNAQFQRNRVSGMNTYSKSLNTNMKNTELRDIKPTINSAIRDQQQNSGLSQLKIQNVL